jgi:hypothetical protein
VCHRDDYRFIVVCLCALQAYLAFVLLFWHRDDTNLQLVKEGLHRYMVGVDTQTAYISSCCSVSRMMLLEKQQQGGGCTLQVDMPTAATASGVALQT